MTTSPGPGPCWAAQTVDRAPAAAHPNSTRRSIPVDEHQILSQITTLVDGEHQLRRQLAAGEFASRAEHDQLPALEGALDQCWDLLRQRRAKREFGQNADAAAAAAGPS